MQYPLPIQKLVTLLKKLPGVGERTAERYTFSLLSWDQAELNTLSSLLATLKEDLPTCDDCGCFLHHEQCTFCREGVRETHRLCVVSSPRDVYVMEGTGEFKGRYHVLGGLLSPLRDRGPNTLRLNGLMERIEKSGIEELILALDSTLEGDATSLYIKQQLEDSPISVSRLAFGLPLGSSLEYVDGGTLARALAGRREF